MSQEKRKNKFDKRTFGLPHVAGSSFAMFFNSLPNNDNITNFKEIIDKTANAIRENKAVIFTLDSQMINSGLSAYFIDWMKKGYITHVCLSGEAAFQDIEISITGKTNPAISETYCDKTFPISNETAKLISLCSYEANEMYAGLGETIASNLNQVTDTDEPQSRQFSLLVTSEKYSVPVSVHFNFHRDNYFMGSHLDVNSLSQCNKDFDYLIHSLLIFDEAVVISLGYDTFLSTLSEKAIAKTREIGFDNKIFVDQFFKFNPELDVFVPLFMAAVEEKIKFDVI